MNVPTIETGLASQQWTLGASTHRSRARSESELAPQYPQQVQNLPRGIGRPPGEAGIGSGSM